jgi:hypothetical protein
MVLRVLQKRAAGSGASPDSGLLHKQKSILMHIKETKEKYIPKEFLHVWYGHEKPLSFPYTGVF